MYQNERALYLTGKKAKAYKVKSVAINIGIYAFLVLIAIFIILPFYWMFATALRTTEEINSAKVSFFPKHWQFRNFIDTVRYAKGTYELAGLPVEPAMGAVSLGRVFFNTILVGFLTTSFAMISTTLSAFAFARLNFKLKNVLFTILLGTMMVPGEIFILTNYSTITSLHLRNHYTALLLPFIVSVFYIYFLRQTFKQIPNELYFASKIDGCGDFKYLFKVMIPLGKATMTTVFILSMMGTWNAYIWPDLVANEPNMLLVSNALIRVFRPMTGEIAQNGLKDPLHFRMAMSMLVTIPLLIVFITLRKYIMRGVTRGGTKG